ncbi:uncharacterized protein ACA1_052470 [Acanthamoeba castellanii str. Neff]|uniref:Pectate lyase superfamily protein domain-containing protein n=1 Tax=Acanthamoeba castellanii (strain ATCC 30010 / Neff) TaxID=1257118 RepID=L8H7W1_ACACF|nr:uncharacterized protein ACA1_052470 [Acanthamoeba castellanii str. Neff]ELR20556.1 hypothetical protein ACA1_052470 [Acanthamoeba castellanii str. Neff]
MRTFHYTLGLGLALALLLVAALTVQAQSGVPGTVLLDDYPGATDDDKLTAALADVKTKTYIPAILLSGRTYTFTKTQTRVNLNVGTGVNSWFVGTATTYDVYIARIGFASSNGNSQFWHHPLSAGTIYASTFETLGFFGFKYVFGNPTEKCAITQVNFVGQWTAVPSLDTAFTLGGSDNELWTSGYLNIGGGSRTNGRYLLRFESLSKTNVGPIYVTAHNGWSGLLVTGSDSNGPGLVINGARFEGMNANDPSSGAVVVQKGGKTIYRDVWIAYGMTNPTANGHTPVDQGMIMHTGGEALWDGINYDRATGVSQAVPLIYASGGKVRVRNTFTAAKGGVWTALPIVKRAGSAVYNLDDTVTETI